MDITNNYIAEETTLKEHVAYLFASALRDIATDVQWKKLREKNKEYKATGNNCCASHELCDPNQIMLDIRKDLGIPKLSTYVQDSKEERAAEKWWTECWNIASNKYLTA